MNIFIPLCGKGERFKNCGYTLPKPLIPVLNKPIIYHVLDSIHTTQNDTIFIFYHKDLDLAHFSDSIDIYTKKINKNIILVQLNHYTKGAAETIHLGIQTCLEQNILNLTQHNQNILCYDCDTFYTVNTLNLYHQHLQLQNIQNTTSNGSVFYFETNDKNPIYSYIKMNNNNNIIEIAEKIKISNNANSGIYCFSNLNQLFHYSKLVTENTTYFMNNECYISSIIKKMIEDNLTFTGISLDEKTIISLGTPEKVNQYIKSINKDKYTFLFDLDGTLVLTDDIYFNVWKTILSQFNIELNDDIFKTYIQGNNDLFVLNSLLSNVNINYNDLSTLKDNLFIEHISNIKLIDGAFDFLLLVKNSGHNIGIVTNCNRNVAEFILNYTKLKSIIDIIIIGNECEKSKPYPDPYLEAIKKLNTTSDTTFIFEDSKTGLLSGKNVSPKGLIAINNCNFNQLTDEDYKSLDVSKIITSYKDLITNSLTIDSFLFEFSEQNNSILNPTVLKKIITQNISSIEPFKSEIVKNVYIDTTKLKGGYITDALSIKIQTEFKLYYCVLKLENKNPSVLSKMAMDLGLYEREYYFYSTILNFVKNDIQIPHFYTLIKNPNTNEILGILLENLYTKGCIPNLNLNTQSIDTTLHIVSQCAKLHSIFANKESLCKVVFPELKKHNDSLFQPKWKDFLTSKWPIFKTKWNRFLDHSIITIFENAISNFHIIQNHLSFGLLTLCHGDVKSPNIFYKKILTLNHTEMYEPYFIDWQYISYGKGIQDIVFFMIESFDNSFITNYSLLIKEYYYSKFIEFSKIDYSKDQFNKDFIYSIFYFPFFVAIWFGTLPQEDLIDKNFPFFFIQKLIHFIQLFYKDINSILI